jgi:hypothetical protein
MARPMKFRLPVMTPVKEPPTSISMTTSTAPLVKASRPTRGTGGHSRRCTAEAIIGLRSGEENAVGSLDCPARPPVVTE